MVGLNPSLFKERDGQIKLFSIVLGAIAVILTTHNYNDLNSHEEAFWWSLIVCLAISLVLAAITLLGLLEDDKVHKIDQIYHPLAAILLVTVSILFIIQVDQHGGHYYDRRAAAGAFGMFFGLSSAFIGWFSYRNY